MPELPLTRDRFNALIRDNTRLRRETEAVRKETDAVVALAHRVDELEKGLNEAAKLLSEMATLLNEPINNWVNTNTNINTYSIWSAGPQRLDPK